MHKVSLLFILFLLAACESKKAPMSIEKLAPILADLHAAEASAKIFPIDSMETSVPDSVTLRKNYGIILAEHQVSAIVFDATIAWYSANPKEFNVVYENVMTILKEKQAIKRKKLVSD